jgi:hypothetical protein
VAEPKATPRLRLCVQGEPAGREGRQRIGVLEGTARTRSIVSIAEEDMQYPPRHYFNLDRTGPYLRARTLRRRRYRYRLTVPSNRRKAA